MTPEVAAPSSEAAAGASREPQPARDLSLHLLRMLETRMDAAGIALQGETHLLMVRLQLRLFAAAAMFIAVWGGIVLLAIGLPPPWRVPVLGAVVAAFVLAAVIAQMIAKRRASSNEVGSLRWFLDSLRQDLEVLSRTLARPQPPRATRDRAPGKNDDDRGGAPSDLAA
jgi:uncharacterized membrane protein YqjE